MDYYQPSSPHLCSSVPNVDLHEMELAFFHRDMGKEREGGWELHQDPHVWALQPVKLNEVLTPINF